MKDPLVSVGMITYNHAPHIVRAIEGVLRQETSFPFELVIGEDCSTDGTREIVSRYQKQYPDIIRVVTSEKNVGMKKNGNRTRKAMRGKYVGLCEGDDYWHHRQKLQMQADYLEAHSGCGLVFTNYDVYDVETKTLIKNYIQYRRWVIPENWDIADIVGGRHGILTCTVMLRRALADEIMEADPYLYQSDQFPMGDTQLWAEMAAAAQIHYIPESMATHVLSAESATRSRDIRKTLRFGMASAELMIYLCKKYNLASHLESVHRAVWCNQSLRYAFYTGDARLAEEVRGQKKAFTWKQWFLYWGAIYGKYQPLHGAALLTANLFRKCNNPWVQ